MDYSNGFQNGAPARGGFAGGVRGTCYNCNFPLSLLAEDSCAGVLMYSRQ